MIITVLLYIRFLEIGLIYALQSKYRFMISFKTRRMIYLIISYIYANAISRRVVGETKCVRDSSVSRVIIRNCAPLRIEKFAIATKYKQLRPFVLRYVIDIKIVRLRTRKN